MKTRLCHLSDAIANICITVHRAHHFGNPGSMVMSSRWMLQTRTPGASRPACLRCANWQAIALIRLREGWKCQRATGKSKFRNHRGFPAYHRETNGTIVFHLCPLDKKTIFDRPSATTSTSCLATHFPRRLALRPQLLATPALCMHLRSS